MKIAIYWEQNEWGGVDSQLLSLLQSWPSDDDSFVLYYNKGNPGLARINPDLANRENVVLKEITSYSLNEVFARSSNSFLGRLFRRIIYFFQPVLFIYMYLKLTKIFKDEGDFDVLLADNGGYPAAWGSLSSILAAKRVGIPVRTLLVHHEASRPGIFMGWYESIIDIMVMKSASAIVCPSRATCQTLLERRNINSELVRMRVIYNEVVNNDEKIEQSCDIKSLINADNELLIGIVGRVEPYKGHEDVIYAISRMNAEQRTKIKFVVIGKGNEQEIARLRRISERLDIKDSVCFLGYVAGTSTSLIKQLDLLVVATRSFEGFGLTLAEAMLAETPVLATRVGAIPEFLDETVGCLVTPSSPRELEVALTYFIANKNEWDKKVKLAKKRIINVSGQMSIEYRQLFVECFDSP